MPKTSSDDILELTDIVEEGSLPEKKTADGSESSFEDELDALFGDVEDLDFNSEDAKDPPMNPNEELSMPDMSDLNSLLDDLDREGSKAELNHRDDDSRQIEGVDELLADILPEAPAEVEDVAEEILSTKPDATPSGEDELDALLDELNLAGKDEANLEADKETAEKKLPLILDPDALDKVKKAEEKEPAAPTPANKGETGASEPAPSPEKPVPATVAEAQEELSPAPETAAEPEKDEEPAPLKAAPPTQEPLERQTEDADDILSKFDEETNLKPATDATEAGKDTSEPLEETADKNVGKHLEELNALIDDIMSPSGASGPGQQPRPPPGKRTCRLWRKMPQPLKKTRPPQARFWKNPSPPRSRLLHARRQTWTSLPKNWRKGRFLPPSRTWWGRSWTTASETLKTGWRKKWTKQRQRPPQK